MPRSLRLLFLLGFAGLLGLVVAYEVTGHLRSAQQEQEIAAHAADIYRSPTSFVAGNPEGDVSVVAFLDYNCPFCRQGAPDLAKLIATDGKVRLVLKELPVLGKDSEDVARIALASIPQGKYFELHQRLFAEPGRATKAKALRIASELGLDMGRLEAGMDDPAITAILLENTKLAKDIGVRGVPFYLVGDRVLGEGKDLYGRLAQGVADIRAHGCRNTC
ncbi:DsbA family protein [Methyloceanibacter sp.]|uniref:DsbA family protein n=1 Tax=Methyloceanibacter sp. TaxID=1965321 RepID=UPI002D6F488C|nr:DsbA family protein [Methyloceanibacter sp.]HZP09359.1 DsbA family protein [Methyloceanibacter sp.]